MDDYEIIKFDKNGISLDVRVSRKERTVWLTQIQMADLFKVSKNNISYHVNNILKKDEQNASTTQKSWVLGPDGKKRKTNLYNMEMILLLGNQIKSRNGLILEEWFNAYISEKNNEIIVFDNGNVQLDVRIEPENETVWLTINQMAELYDTTFQNVYMHIKNLYEEGELDSSVLKKSLNTDSVYKKSLVTEGPVWKKSFLTEMSVTKESSATQKQIIQTAADGKSYLTTLYNLDVILSVGYRVKNKRAIEFRRWVNSILKQYLLKGYVIDKNRAIVTKNNFLNLYSEVYDLKNRMTTVEKQIEIFRPNEKVLIENQKFTAFAYINSLLRTAEKRITIIDGYLDNNFLKFFADVNSSIEITLITHKENRINEDILNLFKEEFVNTTIIENKSFHDRFLIIDDSIYSIGSSLNSLGKKLTTIRLMDKTNPDDIISNIIDTKN